MPNSANNGRVIKTTIDENGIKETKEEASKSIEFSKFLQEDNQQTPTPNPPSAREREKGETQRRQEIEKEYKSRFPEGTTFNTSLDDALDIIVATYPTLDAKTPFMYQIWH